MPQNANQQIVEIVRDAPGQHPQALQFLRMLDLSLELLPRFLRPLALRDIDDRAEYPGSLFRLNRIQTDLDGKFRPILAKAEHVPSRSHRSCLDGGKELAAERRVLMFRGCRDERL